VTRPDPLVDLALERSVLAAAVRRPHYLDETGIRGELFTASEHVALANAVTTHLGEGGVPGELEVAMREHHARTVEACLAESDPLHASTSPGFGRGVKRLRRLAALRTVQRRVDRVRAAVVSGELERATELLGVALSGIDFGDVPSGTLGDAAQAYAEATIAAEAAEATRDPNEPTRRGGLRCGLRPVDDALRGQTPGAPVGFREGALWIFGGRSGCRKSSVALLAAATALEDGYDPTIISIEDSRVTWGERIVLLEAARRKLSTSRADLMRAAALASSLRGRIVYPLDGTPSSVLDEVRKALASGSDLVLVDYVQAIQWPSDTRRVDKAIANFARQAHALARRAGAVVAIGSQLVTEKGKEHREPTFHDLRECKELFDAADVVTLTWKPFAEHDAIVRGRVRKLKWASGGTPFTLEIAEQGMVCGAFPGHAKPVDAGEFSDADEGDESAPPRVQAPVQRPISFGGGVRT
jgi:replicative DNA helicase